MVEKEIEEYSKPVLRILGVFIFVLKQQLQDKSIQVPVSYTHLDVYKRQLQPNAKRERSDKEEVYWQLNQNKVSTYACLYWYVVPNVIYYFQLS